MKEGQVYLKNVKKLYQVMPFLFFFLLLTTSQVSPPPHPLPPPSPHPHPLSPTPTVQCILFNDMLVFAHGSTKLSKLELQLDLEAVWVEDLQDLDPQTGQSCSTRHDHLDCLFWPALWPVTGREDLISYSLGNTAALRTSCSSHPSPPPSPPPPNPQAMKMP